MDLEALIRELRELPQDVQEWIAKIIAHSLDELAEREVY